MNIINKIYMFDLNIFQFPNKLLLVHFFQISFGLCPNLRNNLKIVNK